MPLCGCKKEFDILFRDCRFCDFLIARLAIAKLSHLQVFGGSEGLLDIIEYNI
jgi:hypothetical protein